MSKSSPLTDAELPSTSLAEQVEQEDYDLCEATQRGLEAGVYSRGILHPRNENGV